MLDASTTAVYIAKNLQEKGRKNLTIITNSIEIIIELFDVQDWTVLSTGGVPEKVLLRSWVLRPTRCLQTIMWIKRSSPAKVWM